MGIVTHFDLATPLYGLLLLLLLQHWWATHMLHRADTAAVIGCAGKCEIGQSKTN